MEAKAQARFARVTPLKARRVVDMVRGKQAEEAVTVLRFAPQAAAETVRKVVESAVANARVKRSEEHTSELQSRGHLVCRLLLDKKNISTTRGCCATRKRT